MGAGIPDLSFSRFLIAFMGIAMLARAAVGKGPIKRIGWVEVFVVATTAGVMAAAPISIFPNTKGVIQMSLAWHLQPLLGYFFAKNLIKNHDDLSRLFFTIGLLGFVSGAAAAYEHATGNVLFVPNGQSLTDLDLYRSQGIRMIRSIWGSTGTMGRILVMSIPPTIYLYFETSNRRAGSFHVPKPLVSLMLFAQFYGSVVAMSRTPWFASLASLFVMQIIYPKFRRAFLVILCIAAVLLVATWDQVAESQVATRVEDDNSTLEGRQARWASGLSMWQVKPVRGWGFGRFAQESGRYRTDGSLTNFSAIENDYLFILVGAGLLGLVPYLATLILPLLSSFFLLLRARSPNWKGFVEKEAVAVYWAVLICYAIGSYTASLSSSSLKLILFAIAGAVIGTHEQLLKKRKSAAPPNMNKIEASAIPAQWDLEHQATSEQATSEALQPRSLADTVRRTDTTSAPTLPTPADPAADSMPTMSFDPRTRPLQTRSTDSRAQGTDLARTDQATSPHQPRAGQVPHNGLRTRPLTDKNAKGE